MIRKRLAAVPAFLVCLSAAAAGERGLVGHWDFREGRGLTLHDRSGYQNHGRILGPIWVTSGQDHVLQFDGLDDYVDCGNGPGLDIRGPMTLAAWVRPVSVPAKEPGIVGKHFQSYALTLYRGGCWWYISSGGNNLSVPLRSGRWHHLLGTFDGQTMNLYLNGVRRARGKSKYQTVRSGKNFLMGRIVPDPNAQHAADQARGHFQGMLDEVKVYNRALSLREVVAEYNRCAEAKARPPCDASCFDRFRLKTYPYFQRKELVVEVDSTGLLPIPHDATVSVDLVRPGGNDPIAGREIQPGQDRPLQEVAFSLEGLSPGQYEVRAGLRGVPGKRIEQRQAFVHREPVVALPAPQQAVVPGLPPDKVPIEYQFRLGPGGGFVVTVKDQSYPVGSSYSFPHGGENRLAAGKDRGQEGEPQWQVASRRLDQTHYEVTAGGKYYSIHRRITLYPNRILVDDAVTNHSPEILGIILGNSVDTTGKPVASVEMADNFTLFISGPDHGLGLVALDDVYQLQQRTWYRGRMAAMSTDRFGLDRGASYTIQWAVYPTGTGDLYDFINAFRQVEGLNRTVEGAFCLVGDGEGLVGPEHRRRAPRPAVVAAKGAKYVSFFYLIAPADDPGMSLEGIEFTQYPKESALLKSTIAETHRLNPGVKAMFHVAHGLYATNQPQKLFPDSRVIDSAGNQVLYGSNSASYYCRYFSRERFDQGHRWWIFYPTPDNSFGKALLEATDYMLDYIGTSGMYADGFVSGYAGSGYTYDTWDGHSVEIDPATKTVKRKMGNVTYMALPVLKAVAGKVAARGGVVITNGRPGPRSLWKQNYITTCETSGGDQLPICRLYVGPAVTAFGDPRRIKTRRDLYHDVLAKLDWGALYFYYGDKDFSVQEEMLVRHMYPFTLEELHAGWIKGKQRIITRVPGVYGWRGRKQLHRVYRSDARGGLVPNTDFSTADACEVRTELKLAKLESAVVESIPAVLETTHPVNVLVGQYDAGGLELRLHGKGKVRLALTTGEFPIQPGKTYVVSCGTPNTVKADADRTLAAEVDLDGETTLTILLPQRLSERTTANSASLQTSCGIATPTFLPTRWQGLSQRNVTAARIQCGRGVVLEKCMAYPPSEAGPGSRYSADRDLAKILGSPCQNPSIPLSWR